MITRRKKALRVVGVVVILIAMFNLLAYKYPSIGLRLDDSSGRTRLHWAAYDGRASAVKKLLAKGADVNCRAKSGCTPLHDAAWLGRTETVKVLIANGADVNAANYTHKTTPLHYAAVGGYPETVEALLAGGADPNATGRKGITPLELVERRVERLSYPGRLLDEKGMKACIQILRAHVKDSSRSDRPIGSTAPARGRYWGPGPVTTWVFLAGMVVSIVGCTWIAVIAFRKDVAWGIICLFFAVNLTFVRQNWDECKTAFVISIVGYCMCFAALILGPTVDMLITGG